MAARKLAIIATLGLAGFVVAGPVEAGARPHPAVVRVTVPDGDGFSMGSGTLVDVHGSRGLVVTNWHVVRDAAGPPVVVFPDGFRSAAVIAKIDRDWDLAALVIWRPRAQPVPLANRAPQPGEPLTIAGYGSGSYRMATGRCTQYVSPGGRHGFEMVELSTAARQGDSGGPIFNRQGELAGVLFGSATGTTSGSFCGRVGQFLHPVMARLEQLEPVAPEQQADGPMIAAESRPTGPVASIRGPSVQWESAAAAPGDAVTQGGGLPPASGFRPSGDAPPAFGADSAAIAASQADGAASGGPAVPAALDAAEAPAANSALVGPTRGDQIKTVLAAIGGLAIVGHLFHLLGRIVES